MCGGSFRALRFRTFYVFGGKAKGVKAIRLCNDKLDLLVLREAVDILFFSYEFVFSVTIDIHLVEVNYR